MVSTETPVSVTAPQRTAPLSGVSVTAPQKTAPLSGISVTAPSKTMPPRGYAPQPPAPAAEPEPTAPPKFHGPSVLDAGKTERECVDRAVALAEAAGFREYKRGMDLKPGDKGMMQEQMGFDPVVGWLACVEGPSRGKSYTIRGGINAIGRGDRMDITITGDRTISMENHAKISYSDRNNRFNLLPGDGRNIVYLNGEEVFSATPLQAYDLIDFGETKLLFVPLCGERFTWKKEEQKDDGPA